VEKTVRGDGVSIVWDREKGIRATTHAEGTSIGCLEAFINRLFIEALLEYLIVVYGCVRLCPCISSVANVGVRVSFSLSTLGTEIVTVTRPAMKGDGKDALGSTVTIRAEGFATVELHLRFVQSSLT
jgi:hypothetical protein